MRWLQELKAGVFDRLRMPAWHLLWVVVLVAATPWLRHEGATAVASTHRLQALCGGTAGCNEAELHYTRPAERGLGSLPGHIAGLYVVSVTTDRRGRARRPGVHSRMA